jgi:hypothetical protein
VIELDGERGESCPPGISVSGADCSLETANVTPAMISAGVAIYAEWEGDHIFGDFTPASPGAIRDLVHDVFVNMARFSNTRASLKTPSF